MIACFLSNISTKYYKNPSMLSRVIAKNVGDVFFETQCIYGECAHEQHVRRTLTLTITHTITAYSVSGNVVRVRILICATRQKPCRKKFTFFLSSWSSNTVRVENRTFVIFSTRALGEHRPPPRRVRSGFGVRIRTRNADSDNFHNLVAFLVQRDIRSTQPGHPSVGRHNEY